MISRSASTPVRRHLSFNDLPYQGQCFYLDIKTAAVKNKLTERIQELGGSVEGFLSRDLSLIITDRDSDKIDSANVSGKGVIKSSLPLSRGQALLKAAQHQGTKDGHGQDFLKNASNMGIKTQKVSSFLHVTSKLLSKIKSKKKKNEEENYMEGMSPIAWDKEKENSSIIKVEDNESLYRPLFKQFDVFPQLDYNQHTSPFDVGIVLTKEKENNNQLKKKSVVGVVKGGYCESCDHWYKCTLREHLKSEKHRAFVKSVDNFKSLDTLTTSLPNLRRFLGKHGLQNKDESKHANLDSVDFSDADFDIGRKSGSVGNDEENICESNFPKIEKTAALSTDVSMKESKSSTYVNLQSGLPDLPAQSCESSISESCRNSRENSKSTQDIYNPHSSMPDLSTQMVGSSISETGRNSRDNVSVYNMSSNKSTQDIYKSDRSISSDRRMTLTQVLQNEFDADDAVADNFSATVDIGDNKENCTGFDHVIDKDGQNINEISLDQSNKIVNACGDHRHLQSYCSDPASSDLCLPKELHKSVLPKGKDSVFNKEHSSSKSQKSETQASLDTLMYDSGSLRLVPEATFSSSCSFGENGVGDVLNFLQSNEYNSEHSSVIAGKSESSKSLSLKNASRSSVKSESEKSLNSNSYLLNGNDDIAGMIESKVSSECSTERASSKNSNIQRYLSKLTHCASSTQPYVETTEPCSVSVSDRVYSLSGPCSVSMSEGLYSSSGCSGTLRYSASGESSTINFSKLIDCDIKNNSESGTWNYANKSSLGSVPSFLNLSRSVIEKSQTFSDNLPLETAQSNTQIVSPEGVCDDVKMDSEITPKNKHFAQPCLQDLCRSGSSIRNWLLPKDEDSQSVRTAVSKLDHTLMEMENSPVVTEAKTESNVGENKDSEAVNAIPPDEDENGASSFVASWIQTQKFYENSNTENVHETSESIGHDASQSNSIQELDSLRAVHSSNLSEHQSVGQGYKRNVEDLHSLSAVHSDNWSEHRSVSQGNKSRNIEYIGSLSTVHSRNWSGHHSASQDNMSRNMEDLGSLSDVHSRWNEQHSVSQGNDPESSLHVGSASEMLQNALTDSCSYTTSISDCTIYKETIDNAPNEFTKSEHPENSAGFYGAAQKIISDDALSDVSGVSSCVTDRGIKIKGLHALKKNNGSSNGSILEGRASSCANSVSVKSKRSIHSTSNSGYPNSALGCNNTHQPVGCEVTSETNLSFMDGSSLNNVPQTEAMLPVGNKATKAAKSKTSKTQKKPKTTQAKKKSAKNSRSSKQNSKLSEDLHKQILSNTPSHLQNPYLLQTMYSPISQPSECAPTDPMSPYNPHLWQHQQQHYYGVPHAQTFSSPQFSMGIQAQLYSSQQLGKQGENDQLPDGSHQAIGHPLPVCSSADFNQRLVPGLHNPVSQSPICYSSSQPVLSSTQQLNIAQHSPHLNNSHHFSSASPYANGVSIPDANNHLSVHIPEPGFQTSMVDFLSSPKPETLVQSMHHSPFIGTDNRAIQPHPHTIANSALPNSFYSNKMSAFGQAHTNTSLGQSYDFSPGIQNTHTLPNVHSQQMFPSMICDTQASQQPNKQLSTICLDDIAEDEHSNLYNGAFRYTARPKKNVATSMNTQGHVNDRKVITSEYNSYCAKNQQNIENGGNVNANPYTTIQNHSNGIVASPIMSNPQNTLHTLYNTNVSTSQLNYQDNTHNINDGENSKEYNAVPTGDTKIRLRKMPTLSDQEPKSNLTHYWNVRKTGECRLVFSANLVGKRKAEEETPGKSTYMSPGSQYNEIVVDDPPQAKRRRCLVF